MVSKTTLQTPLLLLYLCAPLLAAVDTSAQEVSETPPVAQRIALKWLGTAGWEIQIDQAVILLDPFITRGEASPGKEWKPTKRPC